MTLARHAFFGLSVLAFLALPAYAAAAPAAIVTWRASTYSPARFMGRPLPPAGATIEARVMVTEAGKVADLSGAMIRWYADGALLGSGTGKASFSFVAPGTGQETLQLRASLPDYGPSQIDVIRDIPVVRPDIAIDRARLPELTPLFYSFSITDPSSLSVIWDDSDPARASVIARNPRNPFEFAQASIER